MRYQAKKYIGTPYAQRYCEPGTPDHSAPLFLGERNLSRLL
jgi:hypothetical protein